MASESELAHQMSNIAIEDVLSPMDVSASMHLTVHFQDGGCFYNEDSLDNYMAMKDYFIEHLHQRTAPDSQRISDDTWKVDVPFNIGDRIEECVREIAKEMEFYPEVLLQLFTKDNWYREERTIKCDAKKDAKNICIVSEYIGDKIVPLEWHESLYLFDDNIISVTKRKDGLMFEAKLGVNLSTSRILHTIAMIEKNNRTGPYPKMFSVVLMCSHNSRTQKMLLYLDLTENT